MINLAQLDVVSWVAFPQKKCVGRFRGVTFSDQILAVEIPNKDSLSKREKRRLWYPAPSLDGEGKFQRIQRILCGTATRPPPPVDDDEVDPMASNEDKNSMFSIAAVLSEQENQRAVGQYPDPSGIRKVYRQCSTQSAVRAQMRALEIELDAEEYQCQPSKHGRQMIMLVEQRGI